MKNNTVAYSIRANQEWLDRAKEKAAEHNLSFADLVRLGVNSYINILDLKAKILEEDTTQVKKYLWVKYNNNIIGHVSVYETEKAAMDDSLMAWTILSKEEKQNAMLFQVCEAKATQAQFDAIRRGELDAGEFITKVIKSYI